jgi:hypothetical protein
MKLNHVVQYYIDTPNARAFDLARTPAADRQIHFKEIYPHRSVLVLFWFA